VERTIDVCDFLLAIVPDALLRTIGLMTGAAFFAAVLRSAILHQALAARHDKLLKTAQGTDG
jgi:hypothetical protein